MPARPILVGLLLALSAVAGLSAAAALLSLPVETIGTRFGGVPDRLCGDPTQLSRALSNLLGNALQHSPEGTPVQVRLSSVAPHFQRLEVHNGGTPIPASLRPGTTGTPAALTVCPGMTARALCRLGSQRRLVGEEDAFMGK